MPPHPIEDPDFPELSNDLLQLLFALWNFVCDLCSAVWFLVSQVAWGLWTCVDSLWTLLCDICISIWDVVAYGVSTVWTFFVETFWNELVGAMTGLAGYVGAHPGTATVIFVFAFVFIPRALDTLGGYVLDCVGVERERPLRTSYAANYQSTSQGGNVPAGGCDQGCPRRWW